MRASWFQRHSAIRSFGWLNIRDFTFRAGRRQSLTRLLAICKAESDCERKRRPIWLTSCGKHFGDAWVTGCEPLIDRMNNHPKDRHVLAAAVKCGASVIVTYNKRDFPAATTEPWGVEHAILAGRCPSSLPC